MIKEWLLGEPHTFPISWGGVFLAFFAGVARKSSSI
jgi:hypothetical protein